MNLIEMNPLHFRRGTKGEKQIIYFVFSRGGIGDYINFMSAIIYIAEQNPHVLGTLCVNPPFTDIAKYIMRAYPKWRVIQNSEIESKIKKGNLLCDPMSSGLYLNATGAHLMDLGFALYCNRSHAVEGYNTMVRVNYPLKSDSFPHELNIKPYAVFTPGFTAKARAMPGKYINELARYTKDKGILPVFLGKADFAFQGPNSENKGYYARFPDDIDYSIGLDLREKTTLLEAIGIIEGAEFILGVDNGLLNLAGTTDTSIIYGHTVTSIADRNIRRSKGLTININVPKKDLSCIGCQSNMRFMMGHKFSHCIYGDYVCLDLLFADNCKTWKDAIDYTLGAGNE